MRQSYLSKEQTLQYGWRLVVDYPMDELYHSITREANFMMSFIFIVMLISMSLAKSLNRITVDPIREIVSNTTNIAEKASSKVSFKQEIFFIKEFNQLISNYREAFEQILSYINEMKNRKILLEQEIELKTKKIITAEESYRKLSENMVDIIYRVNLTPVIKIGYINPAAERILGYSLKDYYDNPKFIYQIVHPDDRIKIKKHISQNYRNQSPYVFRFITNFGVTKWLELKDTFVYGENGKTIQIEGVARDVTDRQVLSELLNDSINQLQTIFDFAPDAILMVDMETGLIIDANQSASKLLDAKKIDIIGKHFLSIHPPELIEYARENFLLHSEGKIDYVHIDVLTSKGLQIPVEVITSKLKLKGRTIICVYIRDITIRQQYEEALKSSLKAKETLLSEVHHRVKNNFQVMLSLIDLKSMMTTDNSIKNILFDLRQRIMIMSLVHESLYHSDQIASHVDIQKYIYDLIDKLNIFYGRSNIVIQKFIDNININFEKAVQIGLIINEIITNSFKHAFSKNSDGRINVILIRLTENTAKLQISDNGKGLPEDFDISRLSSLGFELVKILSSQLNSTLDIESHEGLTITLIFPI
ncbi:MAG TPA: PAS domain S-box protein [Nitrospirae bacterium]|nr:PAS domain S-box protein [Nitrospirota bacterium]